MMLPITVVVLLCLGFSLAADYKDLKCWRNKIPQQVDRLEGTHEVLDKQNYKKRADAISKCHVAAMDGGYDFFSVGNKGQCWAGHGEEYQKYGRVDKCPDNGKGLYGIMNVYEMVNKLTTKSPEAHGEYCDGEYCSADEQCVGSWWRGKSCQAITTPHHITTQKPTMELRLTTIEELSHGEYCDGEYCSADEQCVGSWWRGKSCQAITTPHHITTQEPTMELRLTTIEELSHGEYCDGEYCSADEQCVGSWWRGKSCMSITTEGHTTEMFHLTTIEPTTIVPTTELFDNPSWIHYHVEQCYGVDCDGDDEYCSHNMECKLKSQNPDWRSDERRI